MLMRNVAVTALLAFPVVAFAEAPNVVPGEWEFTSVTSISGDMDMPAERETYRQCISQDELNAETFFDIEEEEGCELILQEMTADRMSYSMACREDGGEGEAKISGDMRFMGERVEGSVDIETRYSMEELILSTVIEGERIGECQ